MRKMTTRRMVFFMVLCYLEDISTQPPMIAGPNAPPPPPPPPPGRGFQLTCSDQYAYLDVCDPNLLQQFQQNAPPGYRVTSVDPCIYPGKNAHRYVVKYQSANFRRCEDIKRVFNDMNTDKPQNSNVGVIAVVPGGYSVEYKQFCMCYRRGFRRRRRSADWKSDAKDLFTYVANQLVEEFIVSSPRIDSDGNVVRCNDDDLMCGRQNF